MSGPQQSPHASPTHSRHASMSASSSSNPPASQADAYAALLQMQQQYAAMQQQMQQQATQQQQQFAHLQQAAQAAAGAAAPAAAPRVLPKIALPPKFKGTMGGAVDTWHSAMVQQFVYYGINDDASKLRMGVGNLEGDALLWYNGIPPAAVPTTWAAFMDALYKRFRPVAAVLIARQSLAKLRMGPGHTVSAYAHRFQSTLTAIHDMSPADQVFQFAYGLTPALMSHVWEKHPATLAEAIELAASKEATLGFAGGRGGGPSHYRPGASPSSSESVPMDINHVAHGEEQDYEATPRFHDEPASAPRVEALLLAKLEAMEQRLAALTSKSSSSSSGDRVPGLKHNDIERLWKEGRCFRCKQTGHRKVECPLNRGKQGN